MIEEAEPIAKEAESDALTVSSMVLEGFSIDSTIEYSAASELLVEVKSRLKMVDDKRKSITSKMRAAITEVDDLFKPAISMLKDAEEALKSEMVGFREKARGMRDQLLAEGNVDEAADYQEIAVDGVQIRRSWTGEVIDMDALPAEYMVPDTKKLIDATKKAGGDPGIPGWRGYQKETLAVRS